MTSFFMSEIPLVDRFKRVEITYTRQHQEASVGIYDGASPFNGILYQQPATESLKWH